MPARCQLPRLRPRNRRGFRKFAAAGALALVLTVAAASQSTTTDLTDKQIRDRIIAASLAGYAGNCPCPYHLDRGGRKCGGRSAWSKPGGRSPICYASEISDEQVRRYRQASRKRAPD